MHNLRDLALAVRDLTLRLASLEDLLHSRLLEDLAVIAAKVTALEEEFGGQVAAEAKALADKFGAVTADLKQAVESVPPQRRSPF